MSEPKKTPLPVPLDEAKLDQVSGGISLPSDFIVQIPLGDDPFNPNSTNLPNDGPPPGG